MKYKLSLTVLTSVAAMALAPASYAQLPLSYNDILQAEYSRMKANHPQQNDTRAVTKMTEEQRLLKTPGTWGYLVNKEKLRMQKSQPVVKAAASNTARQQKPNRMPTTWSEGIRMQQQKSSNK
ncbi:hypothetical protein [uncultured Methylophaga sp.]|uniref:hypothetical protein n=1 Tax=uncultured Methylophaga sp. TaxID=285271 RepID=UPI002636B088|nr:hypothetical protein [uncultured Methylophaga sp.]